MNDIKRVARLGFEPRPLGYEPNVVTFTLSRNIFVDDERFELSTNGCKPIVFPIKLKAHIFFRTASGIRTRTAPVKGV